MLGQLFLVGLLGLKYRIISQIKSAEKRRDDKTILEKMLAHFDLQKRAFEEELNFIDKVEKKLAIMTDIERNTLFEQLDTLPNDELGILLKNLLS